MKKIYKLLVNDEWVEAELTAQQVNDITDELNGKCVVNKQYDIILKTGEIVDLGIIDNIKIVQNNKEVEEINKKNIKYIIKEVAPEDCDCEENMNCLEKLYVIKGRT